MKRMLYPREIKPTVPETGDNIPIKSGSAVILMKGGNSAGVAAHMMVAKKIISDNMFTGKVKSEAERW